MGFLYIPHHYFSMSHVYHCFIIAFFCEILYVWDNLVFLIWGIFEQYKKEKKKQICFGIALIKYK